MKSLISKATITLLLFSILLASCSTAKYSVSFKKQKKHLDTLSIAKPFVEIYAITRSKKYLDTTLTSSNIKTIEKTTLNLLDSKYNLKKTILKNSDTQELKQLLEKLESSPKQLVNISVKKAISYFKDDFDSRFVLLLIYNGSINPNYGTNHNLKEGMATGLIVVNPSAKPHSDLRLLIIDKEKEKVVYYDKFRSGNYDPRLPSQVEQMTKTILKSVYYK